MKSALLLLLLASAMPAAEAPRTDAVNPPRPVHEDIVEDCRAPGASYALTPELTPLRARPQRLIDLPPARLELTVLRTVAGCPQPAVLREGIGAQGWRNVSPGR